MKLSNAAVVENHLTQVSGTHLRYVQKSLLGGSKADGGQSLKERLLHTKIELDHAQQRLQRLVSNGNIHTRISKQPLTVEVLPDLPRLCRLDFARMKLPAYIKLAPLEKTPY